MSEQKPREIRFHLASSYKLRGIKALIKIMRIGESIHFREVVAGENPEEIYDLRARVSELEVELGRLREDAKYADVLLDYAVKLRSAICSEHGPFKGVMVKSPEFGILAGFSMTVNVITKRKAKATQEVSS